MKVRAFRAADTQEVANLIRETFALFNKEDGEKEAAQKYIDSYDLRKREMETIRKMFLGTPICFVAEEKKKIIGMIRGTQHYLINLFIDKTRQGSGVGKKLLLKFEQEAKHRGSKEMRVKSSLFAVPFYQKMGYQKTTGVRNFRGLQIQPMKKVLVS